MRGEAQIFTKRLLSAESIAASGNATTEVIDLNGIVFNGAFSVQYLITGDGTAKIEYLLSNEAAATNMIEPSTATDVGSALTKTTGPGSDGKDILPFEPECARWLQLKVTETGGANGVVVTLDIAIQ